TSYCLSAIELALTFTLMLIAGALLSGRPRSDMGAPGLSKERSFRYCARMLSVGCAPLPFWGVPAGVWLGVSAISRGPLDARRACRLGFTGRICAMPADPAICKMLLFAAG